MNPRPLAPLFSSPRQLLEKARRDLARLETGILKSDLEIATEAMRGKSSPGTRDGYAPADG
jgi:hypothetical protein